MGVDDKYTTALLHFDGGFKDESGKIWTPYGNLSECGSKALVTTGGQGLSCASDDFCFGTNDFTIDFWYKQTSWSYNYNSFAVMVLLNIVAQSPAPNLAIGLSDGGVSKSSTLRIWSGSFDKTGTTIVSDGINHQIAVVRSSSSILCFIDGILNLTIPFSGSIGVSPSLLSIGACGTYNWGLAASEIDEFRVSNIARWTSNFAPPTAPYSGVSVNLIATAGDSQVTLSWTAVSEATGYEVKRFTTAGGPYITIATNVTSTHYTDNAVTNGITYCRYWYYVLYA
jgi:hypothetical protein